MAMGEQSKISVLTVTITVDSLDLLTGSKGLLAKHSLYQGMSNVQFLRVSIAHALKNLPSKSELFDLIQFSRTPETFEQFLRAEKQ